MELVDPGVERDAECERIGRAILAEMRRAPEPPSRLLLDAFAIELATHLVRRWSNLTGERWARASGGLSLAARRRVIERVEADLSEDLSMDELAAEVGSPPPNSARLFDKPSGTRQAASSLNAGSSAPRRCWRRAKGRLPTSRCCAVFPTSRILHAVSGKPPDSRRRRIATNSSDGRHFPGDPFKAPAMPTRSD